MRFHLREHRRTQQDLVGLRADGPRHRDQNPVDLALLFVEQSLQLVVLLDGFERFHEYSLPGRGGPVNDAGNLAAKLRLHRNHEALAAHGDQIFLGGAFRRQRAQRFAQALLNDAMLALQRPPDAAQFVRGVVGERAIGLDLAAQGFQQRREVVRGQWRGKRRDAGPVAITPGIGLQQRAPGRRALNHGQQRIDLRAFKGDAFEPCLVQQVRRIEQAVEVERAAAGEEVANLRGAPLLDVDPRRVRARLQRQHPGAP